MGVLDAKDKEKGVEQLLSWENRDAEGSGKGCGKKGTAQSSGSAKELDEVLETNFVSNADD